MERSAADGLRGPLGGLVAAGLVGVCQHAIRPTASYRTLELGGTATTVGLIAAAYALLAVAFAIPIGRAIDRADPRGYFVGGAALLVCGTLLSAVAPVVAVLAVGQALAGLGRMSAAVSIQTITANRRHSDRDRGFARLAVATSTGQLIGPLMAGFLLDRDESPIPGLTPSGLAFTAAAGVGALAVVIALRSIPRVVPRDDGRDPTSAERTPVSRILRRRGVPQSLLVGLAVMTGIDLTTVYLPLLGEARGIAPAVVGFLLSVRAGAGLASRLALPRMLDLLGRRRLLLISVTGAGLAVIGVTLSSSVWLLTLLLAAVGYGLGIGTPLTMSWLSMQTPRAERGTALAVRLTGSRIAQVVLPIGFGGLAAVFGPGAVFAGMAVTLLACTPLLRPRDEQP